MGTFKTYSEYPYDDPAFDKAPRDLSWLIPLEPSIAKEMQPHWDERLELHPFEEFRNNLDTLIQESSKLGLSLPTTFVELMSSLEDQKKIPSATACYFDLSFHIIESPFVSGNWIIRFLNDQQACCAWYLHFVGSNEPSVICSHPIEEFHFLDEIELPLPPASMEELHKWTFFAAPCFEAFLYRFWLENIGRFREYSTSKPKPPMRLNLFSWIKSRLRR